MATELSSLSYEFAALYICLGQWLSALHFVQTLEQWNPTLCLSLPWFESLAVPNRFRTLISVDVSLVQFSIFNPHVQSSLTYIDPASLNIGADIALRTQTASWYALCYVCSIYRIGSTLSDNNLCKFSIPEIAFHPFYPMKVGWGPGEWKSLIQGCKPAVRFIIRKWYWSSIRRTVVCDQTSIGRPHF